MFTIILSCQILKLFCITVFFLMNIKLVNKETDAMGIPMTQNTIIIEIEMRLMNIPQKNQ